MPGIVLLTLALVAIAAAAPGEQPPSEILSYNSHQNLDGSYNFAFKTSDGSSKTETGVVKEALDEENKPQRVVVVSGSYSYLNGDGNPDVINYFADETGFHAEGNSIPKVSRR